MPGRRLCRTSSPRWSSFSSTWSLFGPTPLPARTSLTMERATTSRLGQVLRVRRITLHEALAVGVDQVTAFAAATFGDQYTGAGDAGRVELPHLDVLHRHAGTQGHAHAVTGVDQRVGGGGVDTAGTASGQDHGLGTDVDGLAGLDADGDDADHRAVLVLHQVDRVPLVEERGAILQVGLVQGVQQRVAGTVGGGAGTGGLATLAEVLGLAAERTLVDAYRFRYGRTAGPCARARTRPRGRRNTCIRSRPGHRCSRSP